MFAFLKAGVLRFGGGLAVIVLMEYELIKKRHDVADEFLDRGGLGQIPGRSWFIPLCLLAIVYMGSQEG